eukprot:5843217-Amphidinium_carterae.3
MSESRAHAPQEGGSFTLRKVSAPSLHDTELDAINATSVPACVLKHYWAPWIKHQDHGLTHMLRQQETAKILKIQSASTQPVMTQTMAASHSKGFRVFQTLSVVTGGVTRQDNSRDRNMAVSILASLNTGHAATWSATMNASVNHHAKLSHSAHSVESLVPVTQCKLCHRVQSLCAHSVFLAQVATKSFKQRVRVESHSWVVGRECRERRESQIIKVHSKSSKWNAEPNLECRTQTVHPFYKTANCWTSSQKLQFCLNARNN